MIELPFLAFMLTAHSTGMGPEVTRRYRFLALGDSYTIGERVEEGERWPVQLTESLRAAGFPMEPPAIIARTGWTTDELATAIVRYAPQGSFDLVTLLIGVNNQYQARAPDEYRQQFRSLLQTAIGLAGGNPQKVIVLSIPDWGVTPYANARDRQKIGMQIDVFNNINLRETHVAGACYVDITPISRQAEYDLALLAEDGLHPSRKMYAAWVELLLPQAEATLRTSTPR